MPAHGRPIAQPVCGDCGRRATVHVHDTWDRLIGPFCTRCATRIIDRLNAEHERQAERYGTDR